MPSIINIGDIVYYILPKGGPRTETLYMQGKVINVTAKRIVWQPTNTNRKWHRVTVASKMTREIPKDGKVII